LSYLFNSQTCYSLYQKRTKWVRLTRDRFGVAKGDHRGTQAKVSKRSHGDESSTRDVKHKVSD